MINEVAPAATAALPAASRTGRAVALLGEHWTLLILQRIFLGEHKYQQLRSSLSASDSVLSDRLKTLTEAGLLVKTPYKDGRIRYEYRLSSSGKATWRIFVAAWAWERQWLEPRPGPRPEMVHTRCGHSAAPVLVCGKCRLPVTTRETSVRRTRTEYNYGGSMPRRHRQGRTAALSHDFGFDPETMELLGNRWNLALVSAAVIGIRRFTDFERFLGIPPTVLSAHLSSFVELGILRPQELAGGGGRTDYRFTDKGRGFSTVLMQIVRWADENIRSGEESSLEITHDLCGRKLLPEFSCGHCGELLRHREVRFDLLNP
ncbi:DNA-binding HxlR family transcriptional regulator [Arthrobacter ginsengisoli]|uniref:DNA-binding HxlR family transcriptional regulator n=1 Tax=Arthrobacter ginsengisoli TaxID=1356565 RepID=A0ABU1UG44_9MICC|nr:helix-turn-helix domain-containing protein [Arthrobacter ginsengisoli]MDR7084152.1 DNA-binding HxlR family transcriptional regulator [Arthrobacter ginsengisoli]